MSANSPGILLFLGGNDGCRSHCLVLVFLDLSISVCSYRKRDVNVVLYCDVSTYHVNKSGIQKQEGHDVNYYVIPAGLFLE